MVSAGHAWNKPHPTCSCSRSCCTHFPQQLVSLLCALVLVFQCPTVFASCCIGIVQSVLGSKTSCGCNAANISVSISPSFTVLIVVCVWASVLFSLSQLSSLSPLATSTVHLHVAAFVLEADCILLDHCPQNGVEREYSQSVRSLVICVDRSLSFFSNNSPPQILSVTVYVL